ncbi:MAG: c-type cytochrome [Planctomycetota bacterium]|nr:MAG: c-type cytochrome [Planctomycetota bacterium]
MLPPQRALGLGALVAVASALAAQQRPLPLEPADELARFELAPGLAAELVASEPGAPKVVDIAFDDSARMWAITATEYPYDGNERADAADKYKGGGGDRVLVFDDVWSKEPRAPRVYADGLFQPLAILPWRDGALVGHGPELLFLRDTDGDGRADAREVWLSGFGIEDSHLLPHRLMRGPGEWIYVAQGAFNYSKVRGSDGREVRFDLCKLARLREGGRDFEIVCWGPNNIWGLVLDARGQMWIQEANDLGMPLMPLFHGAAYKGIGDDKPHAHAPWQPELAPFQMGGTGLSGLAELGPPFALEPDGPGDQTFAVANPIANSLQSIRAHEGGGIWRLERGPDLLVSKDPWFRPIAVHNGPDGCLYIVDWYNEIISHNEVPRSDPRRDKQRGRIWRVRPSEHVPVRPRDVARAPAAELPGFLLDGTRFEKRAAWRELELRGTLAQAPALFELAEDPKATVEQRLLASWSVDALGGAVNELPLRFSMHWDAALQAEAARLCEPLARDRQRSTALNLVGAYEPRVALAALRVFATRDALSPAEIERIAEIGAAAAADRTVNPLGAYRQFIASQARAVLEHAHARLDRGSAEARAFAALALPDRESAHALAALWPELARPPRAEEIDRLLIAHWAEPTEAALADAVRTALGRAESRDALVERALAATVVPREVPLRAAWGDAVRGTPQMLRAARKLRLGELAPELTTLAWREPPGSAQRVELLRTLTELGAATPELCLRYALDALPGESLQREALQALVAMQGSEECASALVQCAASLPDPLARIAIDALSNMAGPWRLIEALDEGTIDEARIDAEHLARLQDYDFDKSAALARIAAALQRDAAHVVAFYGGDLDRIDTDLVLDGPFTIAAWVRLPEPITNADGILGRRGSADFNFADGRPRFYAGPQIGDVVIAARAVEPDRWTHVAFTRDATGIARVYVDGELSATGAKPCTSRFDGLDIGATTPPEGTFGLLTGWRSWDRALDEAELAQESAVAQPMSAELLGLRRGRAEIVRTHSGPPVLSPERAAQARARWDKYAALLRGGGDALAGRPVFERTCMTCHAVGGKGGTLAPPLDGAGLRSADGLLAAILYPSRAVEGGYRQWRIRTRAGDDLTGIVVRRDEREVVLRRVGLDDLAIPRADIASAEITSLSAMPDGQLESLPDAEAAALLAYLAALR